MTFFYEEQKNTLKNGQFEESIQVCRIVTENLVNIRLALLIQSRSSKKKLFKSDFTARWYFLKNVQKIFKIRDLLNSLLFETFHSVLFISTEKYLSWPVCMKLLFLTSSTNKICVALNVVIFQNGDESV